ncbi:alpha/beta hydrolase [Paenibacillus sp. N1-5-1-14]|uniref:alpha/beta hydrolase n=1 Tax=Paenibacillus radicibacter TaxID=2972488 RepID=UPI002158EA7F|nr:alpha/beta hydrolase [Paenibacillus radicibacter]MCR8642834.1 alpha/beta hydrolase [Paenibacillus radicibacter]
MMNKEEYKRMVTALEHRTVVKHVKGMDITCKLLPDSDAEGVMDERVLGETLKMMEKLAAMPKSDPSQVDPMAMVVGMRAWMGWPNTDVTTKPIRTEARTIEGSEASIPVRIYTPESDAAMPAVVFFHGGGFFGGTLDVVENPCKAIAEKANAVVISVDYRLAPEHAYPAGFNDCWDVVKWVHEHASSLQVNPDQIAVCGDSAGGNLSTVCALKDRELGTGLIKFQALLYPTVNMAGATTDDYEWKLEDYTIADAHRELISGGLQGMAGSTQMLNAVYLQGVVPPTDMYASPLLTDLKGMPETLIITAEYDFLTREGEAYARKLQRAGVNTQMIRYNGMDHAFMDKIGYFPQAEDAMNEVAKGIKRVFG